MEREANLLRCAKVSRYYTLNAYLLTAIGLAVAIHFAHS